MSIGRVKRAVGPSKNTVFHPARRIRAKVERVCREALEQPNRHAALRALRSAERKIALAVLLERVLRNEDAAYVCLLCSADALAPGGSLEQLLEASGRFAGDLAEKLRERSYRSVVPLLAQGIVDARGLCNATARHLANTYEMALVLLFRLLFVAYAEDKDLLPCRWNGLYRRRSLKTKARELAELARAGTPFGAGDGLWHEMAHLFRAADRGSREWGVPAYNGGLFSADPAVSRAGVLLAWRLVQRRLHDASSASESRRSPRTWPHAR